VLTDERIDAYLAPLSGEQADCVRGVRSVIQELNSDLIEEIDEGKWFGGLLTYYTGDRIHVFALGPLTGGNTTFHSMAYYGSTALQERHGAALKRLQSGKSCFKLQRIDQFPVDALRDIVAATPRYAEVAREMFAKRKRK